MADRRKHLTELASNAAQRSGLNALSFRTLVDEAGIRWLQQVLEHHSGETAAAPEQVQVAGATIWGLEGALLVGRVDGTRILLSARKEMHLSPQK